MMGFGIIGILLIVFVLYKTDVFGKKGATYIEEDDDVLEMIKKRYARGEITREEFDSMKRSLS